MPYVDPKSCIESTTDTPNVTMVRVQGVRLVSGRIPREVRKELMAGVAAGRLGRLTKDGLRPEAFFHPNSKWKAMEQRDRAANAGVRAIAKVMVCASDLTEDQQEKLLTLTADRPRRMTP